MTVGAVLFALNNDAIDYTRLAVYAADKVKKFLNIPVTLITDSPHWLEGNYPNHGFDNVITISEEFNYSRQFNDGTIAGKMLSWRNQSRNSVYRLTPYDKTLVIDSDFVINSNLLQMALDLDTDFQIYKKGFDIATWRNEGRTDRMNQYSIPFYWATVFVFQKTTITEAFFDLIEYIKINWNYFRVLYSIESVLYRNDYAFSIAIHIMNGKTNGEFATELPGKLFFSTDKDILVNIDDNKMKFLIEKPRHLGEYYLAKITDTDVHIMNKYSLSRFIEGGSGV